MRSGGKNTFSGLNVHPLDWYRITGISSSSIIKHGPVFPDTNSSTLDDSVILLMLQSGSCVNG